MVSRMVCTLAIHAGAFDDSYWSGICRLSNRPPDRIISQRYSLSVFKPAIAGGRDKLPSRYNILVIKWSGHSTWLWLQSFFCDAQYFLGMLEFPEGFPVKVLPGILCSSDRPDYFSLRIFSERDCKSFFCKANCATRCKPYR